MQKVEELKGQINVTAVYSGMAMENLPFAHKYSEIQRAFCLI